MRKGETRSEGSEILSGMLDILGLRIDLGKLVASPEEVQERLKELRERLRRAGGKEVLSDEEWRRGGASVTGYIRTRGSLGEREFHVGTTGRSGRTGGARPTAEPAEVVEPPVDVFDEGARFTVVADVPGTSLDDWELRAEGRSLAMRTKPGTRRGYRKELDLDAALDPDSLQATCRNGVLEIHLRKRATEEESPVP